MSKLIEKMITDIMLENGRNLDSVIIGNVEGEKFDHRLIVPGCLTSNFLTDVNNSIEDGFLSICESQENYNAKLNGDRFKTVRDLKEGFKDKSFEKATKKASDMDKFIYAINNNYGGFQQTFNNDLFLESLNKINSNHGNEHFVVQLLAAITEAKINAKTDKDIEEIVKIEETCKPLVYFSLKKKNPFAHIKDVQNAVTECFEEDTVQNQRAKDYFRMVNIEYVVKSRLPGDNYLNTNIEQTNEDNTLVTIYPDGFQRALIWKTNEKAIDTDSIMELVKNSDLTAPDVPVGKNAKNLQKALLLINDKVNAYNALTDETYIKKPITDKKNFLQSALVFLLLLDNEKVEDYSDLIGIGLGNTISDIIYSMKENENEISKLKENAFNIANEIVKENGGNGLSEDLLKKTKKKTKKTKKPNETENEDGEKKPAKKTKKKTDETEVIIDPNKVRIIPKPDPNKASDFTGTNIKSFYKIMTKKLIDVLGKVQIKFADLDEKIRLNEEAKANGKKSKKDPLTPKQRETYDFYTKLYSSLANISVIVDDLKAMHADMETMATKMAASIKKGEDFSMGDKEKAALYLSEEQYEKNVERFEQYEAFYQFVKTFDNCRKVSLEDILAIRKTQPTNPLNKTLKYFGPAKEKAAEQTEPEKPEEVSPEHEENHHESESM